MPFSWFGAYSSYYEWSKHTYEEKKSELPSPGSVLEPGQRKRPDSCGSLARSLSRSGCGGEVVCGPGSVQGGSPGGLIPLLPKPFFFLSFWHIWSHLRGTPPRWGVSGMSYLVETPWANSGRPGEIYVCLLFWECFGVIRDCDHLHVKTVFSCRLIIN